MKNKQSNNALIKRIAALEKIVKSNQITLTDPDDKNKQILIRIENGTFKIDSVIKSVTISPDPIISQPI